MGEHERITCDRFEARTRVGGGWRRIVGVRKMGAFLTASTCIHNAATSLAHGGRPPILPIAWSCPTAKAPRTLLPRPPPPSSTTAAAVAARAVCPINTLHLAASLLSQTRNRASTLHRWISAHGEEGGGRGTTQEEMARRPGSAKIASGASGTASEKTTIGK